MSNKLVVFKQVVVICDDISIVVFLVKRYAVVMSGGGRINSHCCYNDQEILVIYRFPEYLYLNLINISDKIKLQSRVQQDSNNIIPVISYCTYRHLFFIRLFI